QLEVLEGVLRDDVAASRSEECQLTVQRSPARIERARLGVAPASSARTVEQQPPSCCTLLWSEGVRLRTRAGCAAFRGQHSHGAPTFRCPHFLVVRTDEGIGDAHVHDALSLQALDLEEYAAAVR